MATNVGQKQVYVISGTGTRGIKQVNVTGTTGAGVFKTWQQITAAQYAQGPTGQFGTIQRTNLGAVLSQSIKTVCIPSFVDPNAGGGGGYTAQAVHFDGSTWLRNGSLTATDGNFFSCSFWFRNSDPSTFDMDCGLVFVADPENNYTTNCDFTGVVPTTPMNIQLTMFNAAGNKGISTTNTPIPDSDLAWHHVLFSGQSGQSSGSNVCKFYLDNVDVTHAASDQGPFVLAFNGLSFWVGADNFGGGAGSGIIGDIADLWIAPNVSLLTDGDIPPATRALFIDQTTSKPVNPSGFPASAILFSGNAAAFATNQGSGGSFATTGTLTNAATSPSS